jgi:hypothetical protein
VGNELGEDEYMNTDDEEEAQRRAEEAKKLKNTPACMLPDEVLDGMGEEVEMVIAHRVEGGVEGEYSKVPLSGKGAWKHWVFYVKWARYSHVHNTWEGYETLRGFGGFKKVMNYCKRVDEMQARKMEMTAEEREEVDWRENMEEEVWSLFLVRSMVACEAFDAASASLAEALTSYYFIPRVSLSLCSCSRSIRRWSACLTSVWTLKMWVMWVMGVMGTMGVAFAKRSRGCTIFIITGVTRGSSSSSSWSSGEGCRTQTRRGRPRRTCWRRSFTGRTTGRGEGTCIGRRMPG